MAELMQLNSAQIIADSNIAFGTSGARGLVTDFTPQVCAAFTTAFVSVMQQHYPFSRVALAIDNRPSSPAMAAAVASALQVLQLEVDYYGVLPTPALAYQAQLDNIPAIMITGSHIPFDRNGIKFYRPDGEITKQDELAILQATVAVPKVQPVLPVASALAGQNYLKRYLDFYPAAALSGKHIGIYEHSSAGRDLYYQLFAALGAKVTRLERSDNFVPIDTEAVTPEDIARAKSWALQHQFDAIFSTDGDGDRPLVADEQGTWLRGDILGLLCAKALGVDALAVPVSCNTAIEKTGVFRQVIRTRIGSPYVIAAFDRATQDGSVAGFEANGGFLLASDVALAGKSLAKLPTRDAILPAIAVLVLAGDNPLSAVIARLPQRFTASDRLQQVPVSWSKAFIAKLTANPALGIEQLQLSGKVVESTDTTDGLRMLFTDGDIVHLRPSGNAPELRCYAESDTGQKAMQLVALTLQAIAEHIKLS